MVWPFTPSSSGSRSDASKRDPLRDLEPSLRTFLERESPVKYKTPEQPKEEKKSAPEPQTSSTSTETAEPTPEQIAAKTPTLFKDGRYAHLWSTYRPLAEIENANTSPQDKLADILSGYRDRKSSIGKAALENCADEQWDLNACYRNGSAADRFTNCRRFMKKLDRCYTMNQRLLRALGYLSAFDRPGDQEEKIQMHADKLYQTMVQQEEIDFHSRQGGKIKESPADSDESRTQGQAEATIRATYDRAVDPAVLKIVEELRPKIREKYADRLKDLRAHERPLEERALAMELIAGRDLMKTVSGLQERKVEARGERVQQGEATLGDKVSGFFGR